MSLRLAPDTRVGVESGCRTGVFAVVLAVACCLGLVAVAYLRGEQRGLDHVVTMDSEAMAYAAAISDFAYGKNLGYTAYPKVFGLYVDAFAVPGKPDEQAARLRDAERINKAFRAMATVDPPPTAAPVDMGGLITLYDNDLGYVDYVKMAFRVFGLSVQSLYNFHFLIIFATMAGFLFVFWRSRMALAIAVALSFGVFFQMSGNTFDQSVPTVYNMRASSVLGIIPALHLALLLVWRRPISRTGLGVAALQCAVLALAIKTRGTAQWATLLLGRGCPG